MDYVLLSASGLVAGVLGGLLGLGGSSIMIPAMVWILGSRDAAGHWQIHQYQAAAMIVNFLLIIPSVLPHLRAKAVWRNIWLYLTISGMVGMLLGVGSSMLFTKDQTRYLQWVVATFFLYVGLQSFYKLLPHHQKHKDLSREEVEAMPAWRKIGVGFPTGFTGGLMGIGGGAIAVPGQQILLKMPMRNAIANSAATIASVSWFGALAKNISVSIQHTATWQHSLLLAGCLAPTAMIGSFVGARYTHTLKLGWLRAAFGVLMLVSAAKMYGTEFVAFARGLLGM
jgi:uncharacterized membrane protein YfcA